MSERNLRYIGGMLNVEVEKEEIWNEFQHKATLITCVSECIVDMKWVEAMEKGMDFVGKAIDEQRRFIRSDGEVQPIEKVKKVSRESVSHLARHSELITREPVDGKVVPDKLYTVERLNDYATYENRFLYRLLTTVKEFLSARTSAIAKAVGNYSAEMKAEGKLNVRGRDLTAKLTLSETRADDENLTEGSEIVKRLEKLRRSTEYYLSTPLMVELSKVDSVRSAIVRNNVLKMDKNFKEAMDLYDFLMAYEGDGYEIKERKTKKDVGEIFKAATAYTSISLFNAGAETYADNFDEEFQAELRERAKTDDNYLSLLIERSQRLDKAEKKIADLTGEREKEREKYSELDRTARETSELLEEERARLTSAEEIHKSELEKRARETEIETAKLHKKIDELEREILFYRAKLAVNKSREADIPQSPADQEQVAPDAQDAPVAPVAPAAPAEENREFADFEELEKLYEQLGAIIREDWKGVKRELRKQAFSELKNKILRTQNGEDGERK